MASVVSARQTFDYQAALCIVGLAFFAFNLVPPLGGMRNLGLSLTGGAIMSVALLREFSVRLRFAESEIAFVSCANPLRRVQTWPLDGSTMISYDDVKTASRWGRVLRGSLVLKGMNGAALALAEGRYTREARWSRLLLEEFSKGRVMLTEEAVAALRANLQDGTRLSDQTP